jgi:general secretion pathway protein N
MSRMLRRPRLAATTAGLRAPRLHALAAPAATPRRWWAGGLLTGGLLALLAWPPATWLASAVAQASQGRIVLAEAQGTLWQGNALTVLAAGEGLRDALVLSTRLHWRVAPFWGGLRLRLTQAGTLHGTLTLEWRPGWRRQQLDVRPEPGGATAGMVGRWPAAWLEGLGAPLNTLRPGGELQLSTQGLSLHSAGQGWQMQGSATLDLLQTSSRIATVAPLGSYRIAFSAPQPQGPVLLNLATLEGALQLSGSGQIDPRGFHLRGQAQAAPGFEAALNNLLNIIGRREGVLSRISIG